tara:strand:- start:4027 stop:4467 length:441 start_codon:yes stop_codon:yes gene_type:complete
MSDDFEKDLRSFPTEDDQDIIDEMFNSKTKTQNTRIAKPDTFEEYLHQELNKDHGQHYDPEGNSSCAIVSRMKDSVVKSFLWECKQVWKDIKYTVTQEFDGFGTPVGWFIQVLLLPILAPTVPFWRTYTRYKEAINDYKKYYGIGR